MALFIVVLVVAAVAGGFVGAEIMGNSFSITGAVVGFVGTAAVLLGLGAYFAAQEEKKKKDLTPEMREVFDNMFGQKTGSRSARKSRPRPRERSRAGQDDPLGIFSDDPFGNTIKNLAKQQADAAARGEKIVNRLPKFVRVNRLKCRIVRLLQSMDAESIGISNGVYLELCSIDTEGPLGEMAKQFDAISDRFPARLLSALEAEARASADDSLKRDFADLEPLYR